MKRAIEKTIEALCGYVLGIAEDKLTAKRVLKEVCRGISKGRDSAWVCFTKKQLKYIKAGTDAPHPDFKRIGMQVNTKVSAALAEIARRKP
jgi:hypothetical protein